MKIEIGPGIKRIDSSWITVGPYKEGDIDVVSRWGDESLPFDDNSINLIHASHVLEHIWWHKTVDALKEAYRVLKPFGRLEVHVPDISVIFKSYLDKKCGDNWRKYNSEGNYMKWINGRIFTYGGPGNTHRAVFDKNYLEFCLRESGFKTIEYSAPIRSNNHGIINLPMTAIKGEK